MITGTAEFVHKVLIGRNANEGALNYKVERKTNGDYEAEDIEAGFLVPQENEKVGGTPWSYLIDMAFGSTMFMHIDKALAYVCLLFDHRGEALGYARAVKAPWIVVVTPQPEGLTVTPVKEEEANV